MGTSCHCNCGVNRSSPLLRDTWTTEEEERSILPQPTTPFSHSHNRPHIVTRKETRLLPLPIGKEEFIIMIYYKMSGALFVWDSNTLSQVAPRAANLRGFRLTKVTKFR